MKIRIRVIIKSIVFEFKIVNGFKNRKRIQISKVFSSNVINTDNGNYFLSRYFLQLFQRKIRGLDLRKWMLRMKIFPRFDAIENTSILKLIFDYLQDASKISFHRSPNRKEYKKFIIGPRYISAVI